MATVRAIYAKGVLTPLEPLDLEEGAEVSVAIEGGKTSDNGNHAEKPGRTGESILEMFDRLRASVPPESWDGLPTDLAKNKKHYLYGHPKEED